MEFRKHALVLAVVEALRANGSWTGKTHVQKFMFLLQSTGVIDVPFQFVLYKHGPYSFDLESEMEQMMSYAAIVATPVPGYGVTLRTSDNADIVKQQAELTRNEAEVVCQVSIFVGNRQVSELERLATAAWIRTREGIESQQAVAERLNALKPHISIPEAMQADNALTSSHILAS